MTVNIRPVPAVCCVLFLWWICFCIVACFSGCATPKLTTSSQPAVSATVSNGGFLFSQKDKDFLVDEGIPSSYFTLTPDGWYMTKQDEIRAGELRAAQRNPKVWQ